MSVPGVPRWANSIRFRLSLTYALTVFIAGSLLIGGLYMWQVRQLDEPILMQRRLEFVDPATGRTLGQVIVVDNDDLRRELVNTIEYNSYLVALDELRKGSLVALGLLFFVAFGTGWWLAGWALRPVHRMTVVARDITATDLSRRISLPGPEDEMKSLADTFDAMLDRLQTAFESQRRFVQDASHELRNPLAVARTNLELTLSDPGASADDLRHSAEVAHRSTERMAAMVDDLLLQARAQVPEVTRSDVDLVVVANEVVEEFSATARQRGLTLQAVASPAPLVVRGDGNALRRAVSNLVSNAVRLAPERSTVIVEVERGDGHAVVSVTDEGPGLTTEEQQLVFQRFWRGDDSGHGTGLGLSIVQQIVERHGGAVTLRSEVGVGSTFTLKLPIVTTSLVESRLA